MDSGKNKTTSNPAETSGNSDVNIPKEITSLIPGFENIDSLTQV